MKHLIMLACVSGESDQMDNETFKTGLTPWRSG